MTKTYESRLVESLRIIKRVVHVHPSVDVPLDSNLIPVKECGMAAW